MKTFFKYMLLAALICNIWSCSDDDEDVVEKTNITYNDIAGTWKMTKWNDEEMNDGRYFYVTFNRKDRVFDIYQNLDTEKTRHLTGRFLMEHDEDLGTIIKGDYDHAAGQWNQTYLLDSFADSEMSWVVVTREHNLPANPWMPDYSDVTIYTRIDAVPDEVLINSEAL